VNVPGIGFFQSPIHPDTNAGGHSIRTNQWPTSVIPLFLGRMPFLLQPCQFMLAWDKRQICWLAYPVAWFTGQSSHCAISMPM